MSSLPHMLCLTITALALCSCGEAERSLPKAKSIALLSQLSACVDVDATNIAPDSKSYAINHTPVPDVKLTNTLTPEINILTLNACNLDVEYAQEAGALEITNGVEKLFRIRDHAPSGKQPLSLFVERARLLQDARAQFMRALDHSDDPTLQATAVADAAMCSLALGDASGYRDALARAPRFPMEKPSGMTPHPWRALFALGMRSSGPNPGVALLTPIPSGTVLAQRSWIDPGHLAIDQAIVRADDVSVELKPIFVRGEFQEFRLLFQNNSAHAIDVSGALIRVTSGSKVLESRVPSSTQVAEPKSAYSILMPEDRATFIGLIQDHGPQVHVDLFDAPTAISDNGTVLKRSPFSWMITCTLTTLTTSFLRGTDLLK